MNHSISAPGAQIEPEHIAAGLGGASRKLLATSLALFDDSGFFKYVSQALNSKIKSKKDTDLTIGDAEQAIRTRYDYWFTHSQLTDNDLRVILWIRLRDAFKLPAKLAASIKTTQHIADDLSAALIHLLNPPQSNLSRVYDQLKKRELLKYPWIERLLEQKKESVHLDDVVQPVLQELLASAIGDSSNEALSGDILDKAVDAMDNLSEEDREALRKQLGVEELNRDAARKLLSTGAGLSIIHTSVGLAGFSAYILAAKASSFIPLVSGPGLVSFLAVLSNPVTMVGGTVLAAWWLTDSTEDKVKKLVATRIIAMLAIQGVNVGFSGISQLLESFSGKSWVKAGKDIGGTLKSDYEIEWDIIQPVIAARESAKATELWQLMEKPIEPPKASKSSPKTAGETDNAILLSGLTLGDIVYSAASIHPSVVEAADFVYKADIDGPISFALIPKLFSDSTAHSLKGYVAEQIVAEQLTHQGHVVQLAPTSNQEGWDLLVDGQPVQIKFRSDLAGIREHFERYPDIPVIANADLADQLDRLPPELQDKVMCIPGVDNELASQLTELSIEGAEAMQGSDIPFLALAISVYRNSKQLRQGHISPQQALEQVMLDGSVRTGLAVSGHWIGATAGLMIFGPAGAWVFGVGAPILAQSQTTRVTEKIKTHAKFSQYKAWAEETHQEIDRFQAALQEILKQKRASLAKKHMEMPAGSFDGYVRWRFGDLCRGNLENKRRLECITAVQHPSPERRFAETLNWLAASDIFPLCYQDSVHSLKDVLERRPSFIDEIWDDEYTQRLEEWNERLTDRISSLIDNVLESLRKTLKSRIGQVLNRD